MQIEFINETEVWDDNRKVLKFWVHAGVVKHECWLLENSLADHCGAEVRRKKMTRECAFAGLENQKKRITDIISLKIRNGEFHHGVIIIGTLDFDRNPQPDSSSRKGWRSTD